MGRALVVILFLSILGKSQSSPSSGNASFVLDGNRVYAELAVVRPDGSIHKVLAFVDMGSPSTLITESLFKELQVDRGKAFTFLAGNMLVEIPAGEIASERQEGYALGPSLRVEATLPAAVLRRYEIVIDYRSRTLTFAQPGTLEPEGTPTHFVINNRTGLIAVTASIDGKSYSITINNGSAYTWLRQSAVKDWLVVHPDWQRGVGAVGASNMMMAIGSPEASGILVRIPEIAVGPLILKQVGALGAGAGRGPFKNLFEWYSGKNALPVIGWLGGNVLKSFRLTIDYPSGTMYWLKQAAPDSHDLDQVGLTFAARDGDYVVAAVAVKNGKPTVQGIHPGDKLIRVDDLPTPHATWGDIYSVMHGRPGDIRILVVERGGKKLTVTARVTAF